MTTFKIPLDSLRLFLVACNMNWDTDPPDYIFQLPTHYEVVFTKARIYSANVAKADEFVEKLWEPKTERVYARTK